MSTTSLQPAAGGAPLRTVPNVAKTLCARVAACLAMTLALGAPSRLVAQSPAPGAKPGQDTGAGCLRVVDAGGKPAGEFPLRHTDVRAEVAGAIARVVVEQTFHNPYDRSIEAVYVFPLPHRAAVDDFEIRIGERVVRGEIRRRDEARRVYEEARARGELAALLDQERPNIFTQQVANIQPGHEIRVRMRYVENLDYEDGGYAMVVPTVVGPRYIPGRPLGTPGVTPAAAGGAEEPAPPEPGAGGGTGWAPDTDRVPDASRITPPVMPPGQRSGHDIQITVDVDAGLSLLDVACSSHAVDIERRGARRARVSLRPGATIPNKDFVLRYRVAGERPEFGLLAHRDANTGGGFGYLSLFLQPEADVQAGEARPKELVFVLDCSGSMSGEPIARSKAAMRWALQNLGPDDTFQIIRFSERASPLAAEPLANTPANVQRALAYIDQLQGQGGTEMLSGIRAALGYRREPERLRIVALMTDGYIGNETEILAAVRAAIGDARLFAFGIGSSVNRYLLDELAVEGRGEVDYVSLDGDTRPIVERFCARIAKPYLTDLSIDWGGLKVQDVEPARLPDLFAGRPLVVTGRYAAGGTGDIVVRGRLGRRPFERRLRVVLPHRERDNAVLGTLWARRHVDTLLRRMVPGEDAELAREVTETALAFRLMTRYTSFVAVDNQTVSADGEPRIVPQPVDMPQGVSHEGVFGAAALNAGAVVQGGQLHVRAGRVPAMAAPAPIAVHGQARAVHPKSADVLNLPPHSACEAAPAREEGATAAGLEIRIETLAPVLRRGQPLRLRVTVHNCTTDTVDVPARLEVRDVLLQLWHEGKPLALPPVVQRTPRATVRLRPGATRTYELTLDGATFAAAGSYAIELAGMGALAVAAPHPRCTVAVR